MNNPNHTSTLVINHSAVTRLARFARLLAWLDGNGTLRHTQVVTKLYLGVRDSFGLARLNDYLETEAPLKVYRDFVHLTVPANSRWTKF